jgi:hypothetical protein
MPLDGTTLEGMDARVWKNVEWRVVNGKKKMYFKGKEVEHGWVKVTAPADEELEDEDHGKKYAFEDGYRVYQPGQVVEIKDKLKLADYLETGKVAPTTPEPPPSKNPWAGKPTANYRFIQPMAMQSGGFNTGQVYTLPVPQGQKYVDRGIAVEVREVEVRKVAKS